MPVTVTPISKSSTVSVTNVTKSTAGGGVEIGNPIGLLLALTYAEASGGGTDLVVTLISKN